MSDFIIKGTIMGLSKDDFVSDLSLFVSTLQALVFKSRVKAKEAALVAITAVAPGLVYARFHCRFD